MALDSGYWEVNDRDLVEVVRCKNCEHYPHWEDGRPMNWCDRHNHETYDESFCSYGERKDNE